MAVLDSTSIVLIVGRNETNAVLYSMDLNSGDVTEIGNTVGVFGIDFLADGNLYGIGGNRERFRIDPNTGAATDLGPTGNELFPIPFLDMTAVPEPGTGSLVIAGLLGLAGWRRARA
jgi:hypothetical protein